MNHESAIEESFAFSNKGGWIVRSEPDELVDVKDKSCLRYGEDDTGNGQRNDGFVCGAVSAKGKWVPIAPHSSDGIESINNDNTIVDRYIPLSSTWQQTSSWEKSVMASISGGFTCIVDESLQGIFPEHDVGVDCLFGSILAKSVEIALKNPFRNNLCWKQQMKNPGMK